jgi:hypothetical protein
MHMAMLTSTRCRTYVLRARTVQCMPVWWACDPVCVLYHHLSCAPASGRRHRFWRVAPRNQSPQIASRSLFSYRQRRAYQSIAEAAASKQAHTPPHSQSSQRFTWTAATGRLQVDSIESVVNTAELSATWKRRRDKAWQRSSRFSRSDSCSAEAPWSGSWPSYRPPLCCRRLPRLKFVDAPYRNMSIRFSPFLRGYLSRTAVLVGRYQQCWSSPCHTNSTQ